MLSLAYLVSLVFYGVLALLGISLLITIHEFGHFIFAKLFNVLVPSFSIGFGPRLIEKKIGETTFALSAIPLGGYVELAGSQELGQGAQAEAQRIDERSFASKPYWQQFLIMMGGIFFNLIFAYITLSFLLYQGAPGIGKWTSTKPAIIGSLLPDSPAIKAGIKPQDTIIAVNQTPTPTIEDYTKLTKAKPNEAVTLTVDRFGTKHDITIVLGSQKVNKQELARLGVHWYIAPLPLAQAFKEGFSVVISIITQTFKSLVPIFPKQSSDENGGIGGPIALIAQMIEAASYGTKVFFLFLALVSIGLAVLNIFPLPILDGGQLLFYTIEAAMGRPLKEETRYKIHYYSWILVLVLLVFLTYRDTARLTGLDTYLEKAYSFVTGSVTKK